MSWSMSPTFCDWPSVGLPITGGDAALQLAAACPCATGFYSANAICGHINEVSYDAIQCGSSSLCHLDAGGTY